MYCNVNNPIVANQGALSLTRLCVCAGALTRPSLSYVFRAQIQAGMFLVRRLDNSSSSFTHTTLLALAKLTTESLHFSLSKF